MSNRKIIALVIAVIVVAVVFFKAFKALDVYYISLTPHSSV